MRVGQGFDIHPLVEDRPLVIAGITIPHTHGFSGHSDGDILTHAICDAILGALGEKDIGHHFSDNDPAFKDAHSYDAFFPVMNRLLKKKQYRLAQMDSTLILDQPRLSPYIDQIKESICKAFDILPDQVGIKGKRTEDCLFGTHQNAGVALVNVVLSYECN